MWCGPDVSLNVIVYKPLLLSLLLSLLLFDLAMD